MGPSANTIGKQYINVTASRVVSSTDGWNSRNFEAPLHKGLMLFVNRSAETGTATLAVAVKARNPVTGTYHTLSGATLTAAQFADGVTGTGILTIYPGITAADADAVMVMDTLNAFCGSYLPDQFRVEVTTTGTTNTFSIGMVLLP